MQQTYTLAAKHTPDLGVDNFQIADELDDSASIGISLNTLAWLLINRTPETIHHKIFFKGVYNEHEKSHINDNAAVPRGTFAEFTDPLCCPGGTSRLLV